MVFALCIVVLQVQPALARGGGPPDKGAIEISDPNNRPAHVDPGHHVWYHVTGSDTYLDVFAEAPQPTQSDPLSIARRGATTAGVAYTQVCGIDVYKAGIKVAVLRNRANVYYYTGYTFAPAKFNWMDMAGTQTYLVIYTWEGLGQRSSPALGVRFETSGYVQAWGNLKKCVSGACTTQYFVSYLRVDTRTYCQ